jgi:hypothetical protein
VQVTANRIKAFATAGASSVRTRLTADADLHVTTSGNDITGNGTISSPFATPQGAWDYARANIDAAGNSINVLIGNGTYSGVYLTEGVTGCNVFFKGNASNPALVVIEDEPAVLTLGNVEPTVWFSDLTLAGAQCMQIEGRAFIRFGFGPVILAPKNSSVANVRVWDDSFLLDRSQGLTIDYTKYPLANIQRGFLDVDINGAVVLGNGPTNLIGTVAWSDAFAKIIGNGKFYNNLTWGGVHTVTGKRFILSSGHIQTYGLGLSVFPGDTAGTIENGGTYTD